VISQPSISLSSRAVCVRHVLAMFYLSRYLGAWEKLTSIIAWSLAIAMARSSRMTNSRASQRASLHFALRQRRCLMDARLCCSTVLASSSRRRAELAAILLLMRRPNRELLREFLRDLVAAKLPKVPQFAECSLTSFALKFRQAEVFHININSL
jgi:hypothetical protein